MIQIEMTDDIRKYEPKLIGPFSKRQIIAILIGAILGIIIAAFLPLKKTADKFTLALLIAIPVALCGFIKYDETPLEVLLIRIIYLYWLTPSKRKLINICSLRQGIRDMDSHEEDRMIKNLTVQDQKKYKKRKNGKKKITYSNNPEFKSYH